ncbi:MAG TPA: SDR family NAD(P)-dependent oxidoreductase [Candidatus Acidoferrales bacterium]|nr:SDR family NAD(P)-dependent oxidoreductase [Candidatus Acidoferrales bacterium]
MGTVLITGTSSGFGLVTTIELAKRGWNVVASMRNLSKSTTLEVAARAAAVSNRIRLAQLDVTDPTSIETAVTEIQQSGSGLDAVVHNAGVAVGSAFEDLPESELRRVMETNFFGVLALTRALLPMFRAQRRGRIVIVSSNSAYAGEPANSIYCASKWAIEGWAESLAYEVDPFGIDVVLIEPGSYRTEIWQTSPRIKPEASPYLPFMLPLEKAIDEKVVRNARDPQEVGVQIAKALEAAKPRFRYPVGPDARIGHFLRGKIPSRLLRRGITRFLGLNQVKA